MTSHLVYDIETVGRPFEDLDPERQDYLLRFAKTDEEREQERLKVNLYPFTAEVLCIGMLNAETRKGRILIRDRGRTDPWKSGDGCMDVVPCSENTILEQFWKDVIRYDRLITFNGRGFDGPFLHMRSAICGVRPTRNLVPYRYDAKQHCDLLDQLTYYGATRKFSLDFLCKSFGIESPKQQGVTGLDMNDMYAADQIEDIAEYNYRDLCATRELYVRWREFLDPDLFGGRRA
jgi:3'-5' exonuclease